MLVVSSARRRSSSSPKKPASSEQTVNAPIGRSATMIGKRRPSTCAAHRLPAQARGQIAYLVDDAVLACQNGGRGRAVRQRVAGRRQAYRLDLEVARAAAGHRVHDLSLIVQKPDPGERNSWWSTTASQAVPNVTSRSAERITV